MCLVYEYYDGVFAVVAACSTVEEAEATIAKCRELYEDSKVEVSFHLTQWEPLI